MKYFVLFVSLVLLAPAAWTQGKGAKTAPNPSNLTQFGFTPAEATAAQGDFKTWEQYNRATDAQAQVLQAQRNQALVASPPDRAAFESVSRQFYELAIQRDLARFDLITRWRATYGPEKSRTLEGILQGPGGPGAPPQKAPAKKP